MLLYGWRFVSSQFIAISHQNHHTSSLPSPLMWTFFSASEWDVQVCRGTSNKRPPPPEHESIWLKAPLGCTAESLFDCPSPKHMIQIWHKYPQCECEMKAELWAGGGQVGGNWIKMNYCQARRGRSICLIFLLSKHSGKARQGTRCFLTLCVPLNLDLYDAELTRCYSSGHREVEAPLNPSLSADLFTQIVYAWLAFSLGSKVPSW